MEEKVIRRLNRLKKTGVVRDCVIGGPHLKPKFSKPKIEIPKQARDDSKTWTKPSCHAEPVSASDLFFSAFGKRTFHPRPQDGVFRCALNKMIEMFADEETPLDKRLQRILESL